MSKHKIYFQVLDFLRKWQCTDINEALNLIGEERFVDLLYLMFPSASDKIIHRYRLITKHLPKSEEDLVNIFELVNEGWMLDELDNPCDQFKEEGDRFRYFESSPGVVQRDLPRYSYASYFTHRIERR
jgi:hypothetical protein